DYRGEVGVILINLSDKPFLIERGHRIAQMVIAAVTTIAWTEARTLPASVRGEGGFGSTGGHA
ncbi:MAG: dUTP diphosphatase, partial [Rhodospirillaceae bacterium]